MTPPGARGPEEAARKKIDANLEEAGWVVQDREDTNLSAGRGVAIREFKMAANHGFADYLLFVDGKPVGVIEAKPMGHTLSGVQIQAEKYATGLPETLKPPVRPLPFLYSSTGTVTQFRNDLDPVPRSRRVFNFHRPETIAEWLTAAPTKEWANGWLPAAEFASRKIDSDNPSTLRSRLRAMPELNAEGLWPNQSKAVTSLEKSFYDNHPRALIQMATGSGKTFVAVTSIYRLIKYGGARRVLFLVDRGNLGEQAEKEFQNYRTPDDNRKFEELYNIQRLTSAMVGDSSKVVVSTIQRLYSMLSGEELEEDADEVSGFERDADREPVTVAYNRSIPPEFFDVIIVDECHRSIYSIWRQVLEYFDSFLVGLTATPAKHTFGFFNKNLVMEYRREDAVADGVNVDFEVYEIKTKISEEGSTVVAEPGVVLGHRDRATRQVRWERPDEDYTYGSEELDRKVVAKDQIRTIIRTFRDKCLPECFPHRNRVPKTLIFAKDDSHAEDIVAIVRQEFGKGDAFAQKITYKTTGRSARDLIQDFRNSYNPRIAVTVDMIATGTDIKPIEIVMFMRTVKSRIFYDQMVGRGVRVIGKDDLQAVTDDAKVKDHFVLVDCVGVTKQALTDTRPLDQKRGVSFNALLEHVATGGTDPEMLSSLAGRMARLEQKFGPEEHDIITKLAGGKRLGEITHDIIDALNPDRQVEEARKEFAVPKGNEPTDEQIEQVAERLCKAATAPLATMPNLRKTIINLKVKFEQIIDEVSEDELVSAGVSEDAKEKAKSLVQSFESYLEEHKDEIDALQFLYNQPPGQRLRYKDIKDLAAAIKQPPRSWTPEKLWRAYEVLDKDKVRGSGERLLTDIVSLVRFALHRDDELKPFAEEVNERFDNWMAQQETAGHQFTDQQRAWLEMMRDHVATSLEIGFDDFQYTPFVEEGGLGKAAQVFGEDLKTVIRELNEALAA